MQRHPIALRSILHSGLLFLSLVANTPARAQEKPDFLRYQQFTDGAVAGMAYSADGRYLRVQGDPEAAGVYDMLTLQQLEKDSAARFREAPRSTGELFVAEGYTAQERLSDIMNAKGTKRVDRECFIDVVDGATKQVTWSCKVGHQEAGAVYMKLIGFSPERQVFICCITQRDDHKDYPFNHANTFLEVSYLDKSIRTLSTSVGSVDDVYTSASSGRYALFANQGFRVLDTRTGAIRAIGGNDLVHPKVNVCRDSLLVYSQSYEVGQGFQASYNIHLVVYDLSTGKLVRDTVVTNTAGVHAISGGLGQLAYLTPPGWPHGRQTLKVCDLMREAPADTLMSRANLQAYEQAMREYVLINAANNIPHARKEAFLHEVNTFQQTASRLGWRISKDLPIASHLRDGERTAWYAIPCALSKDSTYVALFISMLPDVQLWDQLKFNDDDLPGQPSGPYGTLLTSTTYTAKVSGYMRPSNGDRAMLFDGLRGYLYGAAPPDSTTRWLLLARSAAGEPQLPAFGDLDLRGLPTHDLGALHAERLAQWQDYKRAEAAAEEAARERERQREAEITRRNTALMRLQQQIEGAVPATWPQCNACGGTGRVYANRSTCHCCGGKGGYSESLPTFHKTGDKRIERPNYSSPTHPTIDVYYEPIGYTTYENVRHACDCCGGTGSEGSGETTACPACGGKGRVPR